MLAFAGGGIDTVTIQVAGDTIVQYDTIVHQYADTFKLREQYESSDVDMLLLNLVAQQGQLLHADDSLYEAQRQAAIADSLRRVDSLELAALHARQLQMRTIEDTLTRPTREVEPSLIRDAEEERLAQLRALRKPTPWKKEAKVLVQLTQNYTSKNWYQGGASSFSAYMHATGLLNYQSEKLHWENTGEWRMGGSTISEDTLRKINATEDLFRIMTKLNYKATDHLYYSLAGEFQTHFLNTYTSNSLDTKTSPFSPIRLNLTLGLDYQPVKGLSIVFSPLAYKMVYCADTLHTQQTEFGIETDKNILNDIGSSLRVEYNWKPVREVDLQSKFYLYTNYHRVEIDWEIACDLIINRFLSARVVLHPRYDNTIILTGDKKAKMQFKELISVGFAHKFR